MFLPYNYIIYMYFLVSLKQQLGYCHGINKRSTHPSYICITGVGPKLFGHLSKSDYEYWTGVSVHKNEFTEIESLKNKTLVYIFFKKLKKKSE